VLEVHNAAALKKLIKFVSARASKIASQNVQTSVMGIHNGNVAAASPAAGGAGNGASAHSASASAEAGGELAASEAIFDLGFPPVTEKQRELNKQLAEVKADISEEEEW
jgi:hypothetical protein